MIQAPTCEQMSAGTTERLEILYALVPMSLDSLEEEGILGIIPGSLLDAGSQGVDPSFPTVLVVAICKI